MLQRKPNLASSHAAVVAGTRDGVARWLVSARDPVPATPAQHLARHWQMDTKAGNTIKVQRG